MRSGRTGTRFPRKLQSSGLEEREVSVSKRGAERRLSFFDSGPSPFESTAASGFAKVPEFMMADAIYVVGTLLFFVLAMVYGEWCDRI